MKDRLSSAFDALGASGAQDPPEALVRALRAEADALRRRRSARLARRAGMLGATVAAATAFAFTPPGRAATDWLADLAGFGEPPTLEQKGSVPGSAVVLAAGVLEDGTPYEVVAKRTIWPDRGRSDPPGGDRGLLCLQVDFPGITRRGEGGHCTDANEVGEGVGEESGGLYQMPTSNLGGIANRDAPGVVVTIVETPPTSKAALFERRPGGELDELESELVAVDQQVLERVGTDRPLSVLIAELSRDQVIAGREGEIEVTTIAFDERGNELGRDDIRFMPASCPDEPVKAPEAPPGGRSWESRVASRVPLHPRPFSDECPPLLVMEGLPEYTQHELNREPLPPRLTEDLTRRAHELEPANTKDYELAFTVGAPLQPVGRAVHTVVRSLMQEHERGVNGEAAVYLARADPGRLVYVAKFELRRGGTYLGITDARTGEEIYFGER